MKAPLKPVVEEGSSDSDGVPKEMPMSPTDEFEVIGSLDLKGKNSKLNNSMLSSSQDVYNLGSKNQRSSMGSNSLN
jgi:hypothetical protein